MFCQDGCTWENDISGEFRVCTVCFAEDDIDEALNTMVSVPCVSGQHNVNAWMSQLTRSKDEIRIHRRLREVTAFLDGSVYDDDVLLRISQRWDEFLIRTDTSKKLRGEHRRAALALFLCQQQPELTHLLHTVSHRILYRVQRRLSSVDASFLELQDFGVSGWQHFFPAEWERAECVHANMLLIGLRMFRTGKRTIRVCDKTLFAIALCIVYVCDHYEPHMAIGGKYLKDFSKRIIEVTGIAHRTFRCPLRQIHKYRDILSNNERCEKMWTAFRIYNRSSSIGDIDVCSVFDTGSAEKEYQEDRQNLLLKTTTLRGVLIQQEPTDTRKTYSTPLDIRSEHFERWYSDFCSICDENYISRSFATLSCLRERSLLLQEILNTQCAYIELHEGVHWNFKLRLDGSFVLSLNRNHRIGVLILLCLKDIIEWRQLIRDSKLLTADNRGQLTLSHRHHIFTSDILSGGYYDNKRVIRAFQDNNFVWQGRISNDRLMFAYDTLTVVFFRTTGRCVFFGDSNNKKLKTMLCDLNLVSNVIPKESTQTIESINAILTKELVNYDIRYFF